MRAALPRDPTNTCYKANAYIPDNNANNTSAHYQGFQGAGTSLFMFSSLINQATTTGWIYLGPVSTGSSGAATITLDDTGPVGTYTAADHLYRRRARLLRGRMHLLRGLGYPLRRVAAHQVP
jgi:hypothetical protein